MHFYSKAGQMALGSRLRQLGDKLMCDAEKIYKTYEVDIDPAGFPCFTCLPSSKVPALQNWLKT